MRKICLILFLLLIGKSLYAQVNVSGANVQDPTTGAPLFAGQWCFSSTCLTITSGSFSGMVTSGTQTVTVKNASSAIILTVTGVTIPSVASWSWNSFAVQYLNTFSGDGPPYLPCSLSAQYTQLDSSPANAGWVCIAQSGQLVWKIKGPPTPAGPGVISGIGSPSLPAVVPSIYVRTDTPEEFFLEGPTGSISSTWGSPSCSGCALLAPTGLQTFAGPLTAPQLNGIFAVDGVTYTTVQSAISAAESSSTGIVQMPPGNYSISTGLLIDNSNIHLRGSGIQATTITMTGSSGCGITFAAGSTGSGINYDQLSDFSLVGPGTGSAVDGICFTGGLNVPNDRTTVEHVAVNNFRNGLIFAGRAIWDRFIDDYFEVNLVGVYSNSAAAINDIVFEGGRIGNSVTDGVNFTNTSSNAAINISFDKENIEYNGTASATSNCAGLYLNGIAVGSVKNSYFEGNCSLSTGSYQGADIRLDGSYIESFDIQDSNMWSPTAFGILNTAITTSGDYHGNRLINQTTAPIYISANSNIYSNITLGNNYYSGSAPVISPDANSNFHASGVGPFIGAIGGAGIAANTINPITSGVLNPLVYDTIVVYNGPYTVTNMGGAVAGRIVTLVTGTAQGSVTYSTAGTGTNALILKGGVSSEVCASNQYNRFQYNPNLGGGGAWVETDSCAGNSGGVTAINGNTGSFTLNGPGVSQTGNTFTFSGATTTPNMIITTTSYVVPQTGLWVRANCTSACTITLPSSVATGFNVLVEMATTSAAVTISPNGVSYDGVTTQLLPGETTYVSTDGSAYHSTTPFSSLPLYSNFITAASPAVSSNYMAVSGGPNKTVVWQDFPQVLVIPAANCNNATAAAGWSLPASGAPTAACRTGSNTNGGVLQFPASATAQFQLDIPGDYDSTGAVYAKIYFTQGSNTTSGQTIIMQMATGCSSTTDDPAFNAVQAFGSATTASSANTPFTPYLSNVTMTGCVAGGNMNVKILRSGSDTALVNPNIYWVAITFPRKPTNQAN